MDIIHSDSSNFDSLVTPMILDCNTTDITQQEAYEIIHDIDFSSVIPSNEEYIPTVQQKDDITSPASSIHSFSSENSDITNNVRLKLHT